MARFRLRRSASILLSLALGACAQPSTPPSASFTAADKAAINAARDAALTAANAAHDWAPFPALYAADAVELPPNHPAVQGLAAITEYLTSFPPLVSMTMNSIDLTGAGDLAYEYGTYHMVMQGPESQITDDGKYLEVWKRQADGSWKVAYDVFNSDRPAASEEG